MASPALRQPRDPHLHILGETCPVCDQPIPNDKAEAVRARLEARDRALNDAAKAAAAQQIATERAQIEAAAATAVEKARRDSADAIKKVTDESAARETAARAAGKAEADAALRERLAATEQAKADAEADSAERIEALNQAAQARDAEWQSKLSAAESAAQEKVAAVRRDAQGRDTAWQEKLAAAEQAKAEAEAASAERIEALKQAAQARDAEWQGKLSAAESAAQEKVAAAERERQGALTKLEAIKAEHDKAIADRVQEAREALEKDKTDALNAEKAKHAEETQKLTGQLQAVTRQLEKKTADELGEGAEVKLFDDLKAEFDNDKIDRVGKGVSGADIIHTVIHNGRECGKIIYDSKNSAAWRDDYVSKLVQDQTAAKADYAVLSTFKFPAGTKQVEVRESVIIVNPARAVAIAQIIRRQLVQVHTLRLSKSERAKKMAALFDYITSPRCAHLLERIESQADALLKLQEKEMKAHEAHWKHEGSLLKSIQKVKAELTNEIDGIIGTSEPDHDNDQA